MMTAQMNSICIYKNNLIQKSERSSMLILNEMAQNGRPGPFRIGQYTALMWFYPGKQSFLPALNPQSIPGISIQSP